MKRSIKALIATIFASMSIGTAIGIGGFSNAKDDAKVTEAATSSVSLAGTFNSWSTTANPMTKSGDYWTIQRKFAANDEFKIVVNGSIWVGGGNGVTWLHKVGDCITFESAGSNFKVTSAGTFIVKAIDGIDSYGDKSYGITLDKANLTVTKYAVVDGTKQQASIGSDTVLSNDTYDVPAKIYRANYTFDGWFTNEACTIAYTSQSITENKSIYAKYTSHAAWTGTVHVDLRDTWYDAAANYAIMFMDKTTYSTEVTGWSTYVMGTAANVRLVNIPYSLPFEPKQMTLVRYNSTYTQNQWNSQKWPTDGNKWGQTPDVSYSEVIRVGTTVEDGKNLAYLGYPKVVRWKPSASDIYLNSVKLNGSNHAEYYSTSITLAANQEFKIQIGPYESGDYYGNYTTHSSLTSSFTGGGSSNIKALVGGTYAFYFDSTINSVYITTVDLAAADEWAQYFLNNVGCDATGVNPPSGWSDCADEYAKLSSGAKHIVYSATADENGDYVEKAVARYDQALRSHPSLTKFIVDSDGTTQRTPHVAFNPIAIVNNKNTNGTIIIVVISVITVGAVAGYFFLRRRKED